MANHTKGRWTAERVIGPRGWIVTGNDGQYDIAVIRDGSGNPENEANAHLISAAPDLLDALKAMREECMGFVPNCADKVDEAIAKAEGNH